MPISNRALLIVVGGSIVGVLLLLAYLFSPMFLAPEPPPPGTVLEAVSETETFWGPGVDEKDVVEEGTGCREFGVCKPGVEKVKHPTSYDIHVGDRVTVVADRTGWSSSVEPVHHGGTWVRVLLEDQEIRWVRMAFFEELE